MYGLTWNLKSTEYLIERCETLESYNRLEPTQTCIEGEYKYSEPHSLDGLLQQQAGSLL